MQWLNEPSLWRMEREVLTVRADPATDFWRRTHDGAIRDSGHFFFRTIRGDFTAEVRVTGNYHDLYDQAGLMVRQDEADWLKCGIEYVNGMQQASVVCTREWSDWSLQGLPDLPSAWFRIICHFPTIEVCWSADGKDYTMIRQAGFPVVGAEVRVGPMIAAPTGKGFEARFEAFQAQPEGK
jgi:regulation of enolase protein 1 (concanavalin A-like superfamily)